MIRLAVLAALAVLAHGWISDCGQSRYNDAGGLGAGTMIVGGQVARLNEFPWQVEIGEPGKEPREHYCGGTIINSNWVLTASHCLQGENTEDIYLRVGQQRLNANDGTEVTYEVQNYILNPQYNWMTLENDIALIRPKTPIALNQNVAAACRPNNENYVGSRAVVSGWGRTQASPPVDSDVLRYVQLSVITNEECNALYRFDEITADMLCAGDGDYQEKDACAGDSGGPLVVKSGGRFTIVGVVSWGFSCAAGYPGVYARVPLFLSWIDGIVG